MHFTVKYQLWFIITNIINIIIAATFSLYKFDSMVRGVILWGVFCGEGIKYHLYDIF